MSQSGTPVSHSASNLSEKFTEFAEKADDLDVLKKVVEDTGDGCTSLWISYLFVLFYIAIACGAVSHADLLLEGPVRLPFLSIELPLKAFFIISPWLFIVVHTYVLANLVLLARKCRRFLEQFHDKSSATNSALNEKLKDQLSSNIFVQYLCGPEKIQEGFFGLILRLIVYLTLIIGPILLLLLIQIQFLPYHQTQITFMHRTSIVIDLFLIWLLWGSILSSREIDIKKWSPKKMTSMVLSVLLTMCILVFSFNIARFRGETVPFEKKLKVASDLSDKLFNGKFNDITLRRESLFSNTIVLPYWNGRDFIQPSARKLSNSMLDFRGRDLRGAVFSRAQLSNTDFTGANLEDAKLDYADLHNSVFERANLNRANLNKANLSHGKFSWAKLEETYLQDAFLSEALLDNASLKKADIKLAHLEGASLESADLEDATLDYGHLQAASFSNADLTRASFNNAHAQAALFQNAKLVSAKFNDSHLEGSSFKSANLSSATFNTTYELAADFSNTDRSAKANSDEKKNQKELSTVFIEILCDSSYDTSSIFSVSIFRGLHKNGRLDDIGDRINDLIAQVLSKQCAHSNKIKDRFEINVVNNTNQSDRKFKLQVIDRHKEGVSQ